MTKMFPRMPEKTSSPNKIASAVRTCDMMSSPAWWHALLSFCGPATADGWCFIWLQKDKQQMLLHFHPCWAGTRSIYLNMLMPWVYDGIIFNFLTHDRTTAGGTLTLFQFTSHWSSNTAILEHVKKIISPLVLCCYHGNNNCDFSLPRVSMWYCPIYCSCKGSIKNVAFANSLLAV